MTSGGISMYDGKLLRGEPPVQRGPMWLWLMVTIASIAVFGYLRLVAFPDHFVPLASVLALLVCLWHRDVRLLWAMVVVFAAMVAYKGAVLVPFAAAPGEFQWLFGVMQVTNLVVAAAVIHAVIRLTERLESTVGLLEQSNAELEASNEELAAREEEVTQQNEELQSQTEELEQQTEELNSQAEELQTLNEQLVERERTLRDLLDTTAEGRSESETLVKLGETIERLLGSRVAGAAVLEQNGAYMAVRPLFGLTDEPWRIKRERSLAELILTRDRVGSLADISMRPDLEAPRLATGKTVGSLAAAPLRLGDAGAGALEVYSIEPGEWSEHELRIVQWLAEQCARMITTAAMRAERESLLESERAARTEAERANRAKDEFVATLSHELRTPLHAILGWAGVLRKSGCSNPDEVVNGLEVIERNARHQGQLISDLLDVSRITVGKLHLDVQKMDLPLIVESALESVRQTAESKSVRIERSIGGIDRDVVGDPTRMQQVVWNLLSNAIKFTPSEGVVKIAVAQRADHVELVVSDSGEGIDPGMLPHLFERYRQADGSSTRRHGGLGLGLAIVASLVELHGGSVEAQSAGLGTGATFTVRLPVRATEPLDAHNDERTGPPASIAAGDIDAPALIGLEILVVDDEQDARDLVSRILTERGADVHRAASGEEAIGMLNRICPDILISDIGMPGMDGYSLIHQIRERTAAMKRPLPAIALTAFARSEDRTRALLAGFQSHVAKPVESAELVAAVASLRYTVAPQSDPSSKDGEKTRQ
jgi:signal transduction histidine kinase/CheY-like chemotaxis protein